MTATLPQGRGYVGQSMSVNARDAYDDGAVPLSGITAAWVRDHEIGCTVAELKDLIATYKVMTLEYHHTGKHFNSTDFYRPEDVRKQVAALSAEDIAKARAEVKAEKAKASTSTVYKNCHVEWLEWVMRQPTREEESGATVVVKGNTATITLRNGVTFTKRLTTTGFSFETEKARREREALERQHARQEKKYWADLTKRFKAALDGQKLEQCSYFAWRDRHGRDSSAVEWSPVTHAHILDKLRESGRDFAERTVRRLEEGEREVVRVGLHIGIRRAQKGTNQDQDRPLTMDEKLTVVGVYAALVNAMNAGTPK